MKTAIVILSLLVALLYLKWVLIIVVFPFQAVHGQILRRKEEGRNIPITYNVLEKPYTLWEKIHKRGWQRYMLFQVGEIPSHHIRRWIYRALGAEIGKHVVFHFRTEIRGIHRLTVGAGTIIGDKALLDARRGLTIGENVCIASEVTIHPGGHNIRDPYFGPPALDSSPVVIGDRVYIGARAMILNGVTIGEGAVLCAGCVVTKDVEPFAVVAGIPARKVNERPQDLRYVFNGKSARLY